MIDVLSRSRSFCKKIQAYSHIRLWAFCCTVGPNLQSMTSQCSGVSSGSVPSCILSPSDNSTWADLHWTSSFSFKSCLSGICTDGTMLAAVTMPPSVWGYKIISLPDKFWSTTTTLDSPGINSEVLPGMNIILHLGDDSTSKWTCFWSPVTFVSPLAITAWKAGTITFFVITTLPFTWSKSNSWSLTCDNFDRTVLTDTNLRIVIRISVPLQLYS